MFRVFVLGQNDVDDDDEEEDDDDWMDEWRGGVVSVPNVPWWHHISCLREVSDDVECVCVCVDVCVCVARLPKRSIEL